MVSDSSLSAFIASNPDARELKRALAVQMTLLASNKERFKPFSGCSRETEGWKWPLNNGHQRQTYYGALDRVKGTFLMQCYPKANAHHTVDFIRYLQQRRPSQKLLIFWDGVSYHPNRPCTPFSKRSRPIYRRMSGRLTVRDWHPIRRKKIRSKTPG